jgi:hypothetical protein
VSTILSPQAVVLLWIFGPALTLSLVRVVLQWRGKHLGMEWRDWLTWQAIKALRKMPLALALAVVGFWA